MSDPWKMDLRKAGPETEQLVRGDHISPSDPR